MTRLSKEESGRRRQRAWELFDAGKSQTDIAKEIGVSQPMVSKYLSGDSGGVGADGDEANRRAESAERRCAARWKAFTAQEERDEARAAERGSDVALNGRRQGGLPAWPDVTEKGIPKRTYRNTREAIAALGIICRYDAFHDRMLVGGREINQWAGELSDAVTVVLRQIIVEHFDFDPGKENVNDAATELCLENRFNPVVDYLDKLDWDGRPRLDTWLINYLGAEDNAFNRAVGNLTLVAAVRRQRHMVDC